MTTPADRIEAAAQLLHERRHRAGSAQVCGRCRADATAVAAAFWPALARKVVDANGVCRFYPYG